MINYVRFSDEKLRKAYDAWRVARLEESRILAEIQQLEAEIADRKARIGQLHTPHPRDFPSSALYAEFTDRLIELVEAPLPSPDDLYPGEAMGTVVNSVCRNCGRPLLPDDRMICDGCTCNSRRGINHGLVAKNTCTCVACDPAQTGGTRIGRSP